MPFDQKVRRDAQIGEPAVLRHPSAPGARNLTDLARTVVGIKPARQGLFARLGLFQGLGRRTSAQDHHKGEPGVMNETDEITEMERTVSGRRPTRMEQRLTAEEFELVFAVHQNLIREIDLEAVEKLAPAEAREAVEVTARAFWGRSRRRCTVRRRSASCGASSTRRSAWGPSSRCSTTPSISEVMVNAPDEVYFERDGVIYLSDVRFRDKVHIMRIIDRIISPLGRRVDESSPYVDARLPDGSRVNVIIPPLVPKSPILTIRKFRPDRYTIDDLVENDTLTEQLADFLQACVRLRLNMVISGGTGTGKTTLLNAVSGLHPEQRADRHDRRPDRAEAAAEPRHLHGGAAAEHRGQERGHAARPLPQRPAHAPRPHHRRRGARRRRRST